MEENYQIKDLDDKIINLEFILAEKEVDIINLNNNIEFNINERISIMQEADDKIDNLEQKIIQKDHEDTNLKTSNSKYKELIIQNETKIAELNTKIEQNEKVYIELKLK
jgi:predicted 3-demethylubiquinone-9 3-methyltransferase (glyoxalase superfamily)